MQARNVERTFRLQKGRQTIVATRRTFSKILVILIVVPVAIRAGQVAWELGAPAPATEAIAAQIDEASANDVDGRVPDGPATGSDDE